MDFKKLLSLMTVLFVAQCAAKDTAVNGACHDRYAPEHVELNLLPSDCEKKSIYYIRTEPKAGWSCGYHALYAACQLEQMFGKKNKCHDFNVFERVVKKELKKRKWKRPTDDASETNLLYYLAKALNLGEFFYMQIDPKTHQIYPVMVEAARDVEPYIKNCYSWMLNKQVQPTDEELDALGEKKLKQLKTSLLKQPRRHCIHFVCHFQQPDGEEHCVLITLTQHKKGRRSLYVYDGANSAVIPGSEFHQYILDLAALLNVSSRL